jgi:hypothetical protein
LFVAGLALISYTGNYGHGLGLVHHGIDMLIVGAFSLVVFFLALRMRLGDRESAALIATASARDQL